MSWTNDYLKIIKELTNNSQIVEIIFPLSVLNNTKRSVRERFNKNVKLLKDAGACIYYTEEDYHLRCTLIGVNSIRDGKDLCVISSRRIHKDFENPWKTLYQTNILSYSIPSEQELCDSFLRNYNLIVRVRYKYDEV